MPPGHVLRCVVEDAVFEGLKYHVICSFDLAVAPWMGHRGVVDVDEAVLKKSQKSDSVKALPRSVTILLGTPNRWVMSSMNYFFRRDCGDCADLDRLGEFVHRHQDVLVTAKSHLEWSH
jgi:hypothetical protein